MYSVRKTSEVIGIFISDIHLQSEPPRARRQEPDWFEAMINPLQQLTTLKEKYNVPIFCAGDVFNGWKVDPELINFALTYLPEMYAIPGQHDLPLHNIKDIKKSAFWTMVIADKIYPVIQTVCSPPDSNITLYGFPWGRKIEPCEDKHEDLKIALCHDYFWMDKHCYPKAPKEQNVSGFKKLIKGYDAVAFGDNHKGFITEINGIPVINCGSFMRRKSDEANYRPQVGLLHKDGKITSHKLNTSGEMFITLEEETKEIVNTFKKHDVDLNYFIEHLSELKQTSFDFEDILIQEIKRKKIIKPVKDIILTALEGDNIHPLIKKMLKEK